MATQTETQTSIAQPFITSLSTKGTVHRGPVTTPLNFYQPPSDGSKPFNYVEAPPEGQPQRNFGDIDIPVTIEDIRGHESQYTLDQNAFTAFKERARKR